MHRHQFIRNTILGTATAVFPSVVFGDSNFDELPNVLIIGDSISIGYNPFVKQLLLNHALVTHNEGNAQHTGTGLEKIDSWLGNTKWDVIHFNWGLWDLAYRDSNSEAYGNRDKVNGEITNSLEQYGENLQKLVDRLKETDSHLIWANTTPVPPGEVGRISGDEIGYNAVAERIMDENGIPVNDLYSYMIGHMDEYQVRYGDVHFAKEGYEYLALKVAACIKSELILIQQ